jgi:putative tryptophan/tyrosine transport system substrate-binding protein
MSSIDPGRPAKDQHEKDQHEKGQHEKARMLNAPKIGILHSGSADAYGQQISAFLNGLSDAGYVDGENVAIQYTWADNVASTLTNNANALVQVPVDVIVAAGGSIAALAAQTATNAIRIPVVFTTVTDPVGIGLVTSLDDPGGNLTGTAGLTSELDPKRLELLKEFDPARTRVGVLVNPSRRNFTAEFAQLEAARQNLGLSPFERRDATVPADIDNAINGFTAAQSILVTADPLFNTRRKRVINRIKAKGVPAIYQWRDFVTGGGLMSYGPSIAEAYKDAGTCVGQILDGDTPRNLPVKFPSSYELVINLKTARTMGFRIPVSMLTRATLVRRKR